MTDLSEEARLLARTWIEDEDPNLYRLGKRFLAFCQANELDRRNFFENSAMFLAQLRIAGLRWSSLRTYASQLWALHRLAQETIGSKFRRLMKRFDKESASEPTRIAPRQTVDEICSWIYDIEDAELFFVAELVFITGLRLSDLHHIRPYHVRREGAQLRLIIAGGKNHGGSRHADSWLGLSKQFSKSTLVRLKRFQVSPEHDTLVRMSVPSLNRGLTLWAGKRTTSYTLRRARLRAIISENTDESGVRKWSAIRDRTLHKSLAALKSTYQN